MNMNRKKIDIRDCAGDIIRAMKLGILITTKVGEKVNSMTIGWGTLGIICFCSLNRKFATENQ